MNIHFNALRILLAFLLAGSACSDDAPRAADLTVPLPELGTGDHSRPVDTRSDSGPRDLGPGDHGDACAEAPAGTADRTLLTLLLGCLRSSLPEARKTTALASFVKRVEAGSGFPIVSSGKVAFVYVRSATYDLDDDKNTAEDFASDKRQAPLSVAGSFNAWKAGQHGMTAEALGVFHVELSLDLTSGSRVAYKFVAMDSQGQAVWFSDPLSRRFGFDSFGRYSLIRGGKDSAGQSVGHLEWIRSVAATTLGGTRSLYLYLPPGYDQSTTSRFPVLYLHDGQNLFDPAQVQANGTWDLDAVADAEIAASKVKPFIGVGIPNTAQRMDEYTHVTDMFTSGGKLVTVGGKGKDYLDFVVNDIMPLVNSRYRTLTTKADTAILGSSLGGLISYYAGLIYSAKFKYIGGMSSTFGWGQFGQKNPTMETLYQAVSNLAGQGQVYYLDSGDNPKNPKNPPTCPTPDTESEDNYCETVSFRDMLVKKGINVFPQNPDAAPLQPPGITLYHYYQQDAAHNEAAWKARLFRPLRLFFRP